VQKPVVAMWVSRFDGGGAGRPFPKPVAVLRTGGVWWWPDVEEWLLATGRETDAGWSLEQVNATRRRGGSRPRNRRSL
jgi:hypothetical protein